MLDRMITFAGTAKKTSPCLFPSRVRQLPTFAYVFFICSCAFSFQQSRGSNEMSASIRTYWPRTQYTLRVDSKLVEVDVVVRDTRGRAIGGLSKDDFVVEDAGKKPEITTFSVETFVPMAVEARAPEARQSMPESAKSLRSAQPLRYVALLFDDFSMAFSDQFSVKAASRRFFKEGLAQGDRIGLFTTSGKQIVPFTDDVTKLVPAVDRYNSFPRTPDGGICPKLTPYDAYVIANKIDFETYAVKSAEYVRCINPRAGGGSQPILPGKSGPWPFPGTSPVMMQAEAMWIQIRDTSKRALENTRELVDYMAQLPGRKMILMASSGFLVGTLEEEHQKVINHALHAEVVINTLDARGLYAEDPPEVTRGVDERSIRRMVELGTRPKDLNKDVMSVLARSTGGLFFENNNDLSLGFRELGMVPEVSYLLGFLPQEAPDGKFHGLRVRLKSKNTYMIQARPGYWATARTQPAPPAQEQRRIDHLVMGAEELGELAAVISSEPSKTDNGEPALEVVITIDARKFHFVEKDGLRTQNLVFIASLFDENGAFVTGTELQVKFAMREPTYTRFTQTGLEMSVPLQAPRGTYRLRGVAQEGIDGKVVASSFPVQIR